MAEEFSPGRMSRFAKAGLVVGSLSAATIMLAKWQRKAQPEGYRKTFWNPVV